MTQRTLKHKHKTNCKCFVCTRVPWNKGLIGYLKGHPPTNTKPNKTSFKKGFIPWNKGIKMPEEYGVNLKSWKGENVGYVGLHNWVRSKLGTPSKCEHCGSLNKKKYEWANKSGNYNRKLNDWLRLCTSCHRKYDYSKKNESTK